MEILRFLTREEVLNLIILDGRYSIEKAIKTYKLTDEEKDIILDNARGDYQLMGEVLWYCYDRKEIYHVDREDYYQILTEEYTKLDERLKEKKSKIKK